MRASPGESEQGKTHHFRTLKHDLQPIVLEVRPRQILERRLGRGGEDDILVLCLYSPSGGSKAETSAELVHRRSSAKPGPETHLAVCAVLLLVKSSQPQRADVTRPLENAST